MDETKPTRGSHCSEAAELPAKYSDVAAMRAAEAKDGLPITPFFSGDGKSGPDATGN
jgi:hypothetical protein